MQELHKLFFSSVKMLVVSIMAFTKENSIKINIIGEINEKTFTIYFTFNFVLWMFR
ncbi:protein of unknown function [Methanocaldococcus lauensis]|nr:protein of unknown function [Methanocaldococcus lauensis]